MTGEGSVTGGGVGDTGRLASTDVIVPQHPTSVPKTARAHTQHTKAKTPNN